MFKKFFFFLNLSQVVNIVQNELNVKISGNHIDKSHPIKKIKENRYIAKFTKHSMAETIYKQCKKAIKSQGSLQGSARN